MYLYMCIYVDTSTCMCILAQILLPKHHLSRKGNRFLGKMAHSRPGAGELQGESRNLFCLKVRKCSTNDTDKLKG